MIDAVFPPWSPLPRDDGTLFRVRCTADRLHLLLYGSDRARPRVLALDPTTHRRADTWEIFVPGVREGQRYNWAVDVTRPLVDPYALEVDGPRCFGADATGRRPTWPALNKDHRFAGVVVAPAPLPAWRRPHHADSDLVIYEMHVRGFTRDPSAGVQQPGGFSGVVEKIDHLRALGVTAVELLPVHEFDEQETQHAPGLHNYWGYSPLNWFAPNSRYGTIADFRAMVSALHEHDIEVIVDVVFNHTAEMDAAGPTWHFRDLDPGAYLTRDVTGCGNTVRTGAPHMQEVVLSALRWWVHALGVDGFRFDLASVLARDEDGALSKAPRLIRRIESDPFLEKTRLIAEAWDAGDSYLVGNWPGNERWTVWNDRFRDDVRRAWLHGEPSALGHRLAGSPDVFSRTNRALNFVTSHDGFTLRDLVSYTRRHNDPNGEDGRDGHAHEVSDGFGAEGPTADPAIMAARDKTRRALLATLLVSDGTPMLTAGDEFGRTQRGNNNAYCHDSPLTWLHWNDAERDAAFLRFTRALIALRRAHWRSDASKTWFGPGEGLFGFHTNRWLIACNLRDVATELAMPQGRWRRAVDTAAKSPDDVPEQQPRMAASTPLAPRSLVIALPN